MTKYRFAVAGSAGCAFASMLIATAAHAQSANAAASSGADYKDEIVVTAEKRLTLARDVPGAVTALDDEALDRARINNVEDVTRLVPGFEFGNVSNGQVAMPVIRGVGPQLIGDPTVSILQDGFTFANSSRHGSSDFFDAARVEVLKGPQSTLYGANSLGGVVNIVSRLPSLTDFEGDFRTSYGEYDSVLVRGAVSIPIVDDALAIRVGGFIDSRDGYWDNLATGKKGQDGMKDKGARFAMRLRPSDAFDSALVYTYSTTNSDCADCTNPVIGYDIANPQSIGSGTIDLNNLGEYTNTNIPGFFNRKIYRVTWNNTLDLGSVTLSSLTGYGRLRTDVLTDADRGPGDNSPLSPGVFITDFTGGRDQRVFTQELRLASDGDSPLRWQVGGFFMRSVEKAHLELQAPPLGQIRASNSRERFKNFALFTHNAYEVSDRFEVQFGLRFDHAEKRLNNYLTGLMFEAKSDAWLPKVAAIYRLDDNNNFYATVSRGYKTGGTTNVARPDIPLTYRPEYLWNYEAGFKGVSADRKLRYDFSAYYINWTDQQVQQLVGVWGFVGNAGRTNIYGAEAALHYDVSDRFLVDATVAYNHARYAEFTDTTTVPIVIGVDPDRSGERLFYSPDLSASLSGRYIFPIGGGFDITLAGDARYTGKRSLDYLGVIIGPAYVLANTSLSIGDDHKRLTVFANNLFDKRYSGAVTSVGGAGVAPMTHLGSPRVVGVQADFSF